MVLYFTHKLIEDIANKFDILKDDVFVPKVIKNADFVGLKKNIEE
jgi:hypothetical protein